MLTENSIAYLQRLQYMGVMCILVPSNFSQIYKKFKIQFQGVEGLGVHKVSLQFQKFITKANEETDEWKLLQNGTYTFKFSLI